MSRDRLIHGVTQETIDEIEAADGTNATCRSPDQFDSVMGIAIDDGTVFANYRSCEEVVT